MRYLSGLLIAFLAITIFSWAWPLILVIFLVVMIGSSYLSYKVRKNMTYQDQNPEYEGRQDTFEHYDPSSSQFEERVENPEVFDAEFTERENEHAGR